MFGTLLACVALAAISPAAQEAYRSTQSHHNASLFWGPYRPNLYMGIRPRAQDDFLAGLMWANVDSRDAFGELRHTCEQDDSMGSYGWEEFDIRKGGRQVINDKRMNLRLTTEYVKLPAQADPRGNWALRVSGRPLSEDNLDTTTSLIFYAGVDVDGHVSLEDAGIDGVQLLQGESNALGPFEMRLTPSRESRDPQGGTPSPHHLGMLVPERTVWRAKDYLFHGMRPHLESIQHKYTPETLPPPWQIYQLLDESPPAPNLMYVQYTFDGPFVLDIVLASSAGRELESLTEEVISSRIGQNSKDFEAKFDRTITLSKPFDGPEYRKFGSVLLSNLLGGIGHFSGRSLVDSTDAIAYAEDEEDFWETASAQLAQAQPRETEPYELFSFVPSRPFFPRGFYWDEGFHLMPASLWDLDLALEVLQSWYALTDENGWIGREQILGEEARSKVPKEFRTQFPHFANPPTPFITINHILGQIAARRSARSDLPTDGYKAEHQHVLADTTGALDETDTSESRFLNDEPAMQQFMLNLYPTLRRHYDWYRTTQRGEVKAYDREAFSTREAYRWRGRTLEHCLTSGIDDYPRPRPPHPGELHVDLHSWMGLMTRMLKNIASYLDMQDEAASLAEIETAIIRNLDDLYWSELDKAYCDQTIDEYEESVAACHIGYVTIFPVLLELLPADHPNVGHILDSMRNPELLWSDHGLRSLAKTDPYYGTNENYWRSPIWININYLALSALHNRYARVEGPHQLKAKKLYDELRTNIVKTVYDEWQRTGIFWEQYNPDDGHGQRTKAFTGWTACVVNILAEKY